MNKNVFRLVYSRYLAMFVPAPETASGIAGKSSSSPVRSRRFFLAAMMVSSLALSASLSMADPLDGLVPGGGSWVGAHAPVINDAVMNINQTESKAILNWQQLNLRAGETLNFYQESAAWSALNRIHSIDPSNIAGIVNALVPDGKGNFNPIGNLYFINSNGIIFGSGAQINVGSLTASSLNITDSLFKNGVISDPNNPSFFGTKGFVQVDAGAKLNAAVGGRIMLLAPNVSNAGFINTPEGQTILAAGEKVYLASSKDLAGLLVEVDAGGTATNFGDIVSKLGNVTMVGLAVNQQGRVSASTSVRANGSIMLLARDTVTVPAGNPLANRGGLLTLAKDSVTKIDVEVADKEEILKSQLTEISGTTVKKVLGSSKVDLSAGVININGSIVAHGGDISAIAKFNPGLLSDVANPVANAVSATRVYLGSEASIDVSGLDASAPMSRNQLAIQLYSEQLKDTPLLRGTEFVGKTIYVDARKGTDLIAADSLEAAKAVKGITISEVMSKGGTVKLEASLGDVILAHASEVDLSGGSITYDAGFVRESQLLYKGNNVVISAADKNTPYEGFADTYTLTDQKWGVTRSWELGSQYGQYYQTYTMGSDAGDVSIVATNSLLAANLRGFAKNGNYQRDGQLFGGSFSFTLNYISGVSPNFEFVADNKSALASDFSVVGNLDMTTRKIARGSILSASVIQVETSMFSTDKTQTAGGFSRFSLNALAGNIAVEAPVQLSPKGNIELQTMGQINVNANISLPGGVIAIKGGDTSLGDNVKISTSGIYTNDTVGIAGDRFANVVRDAGTITIEKNDTDNGGLSIGRGVRIEANAGAWLNGSNQLAVGKGGNITLTGVAGLGDIMISAYGFSKGGSLSLSAYRNIQTGGQPPVSNSLSNTLWLPESFFGQGGFSQFNIKTNYLESSILIGDVARTATTIQPQTETLMTNAGYRALLSGADMSIVASPILPASYLRKPSSITFNSYGNLILQENATVKLDAPNSGVGGSIVFQSNGQLTLLGSLIAPAGAISAGLLGSMSQYPSYDDKLSIFVGSNALLSAKGHYVITPSNSGVIKAAVSDAGSISLNGGDRAVVVVKDGSLMDVSGASGEVDVSLQSGYARQTLNGSAGSISITARNGMVLDGDMQAAASASGTDGSLSLTFAGGDDSNNFYPNGSRTLELTSAKVIRGLAIAVDSALTSVTGSGVISAQQIADAGFGKLTLDVDRSVDGDKILVANGLNLKLQNAIILKASLLEVANNRSANLVADYIAVGGASKVAPSSGGAELQLDAQWIDLIGDVGFAGVNKTTLNARLDIRGRGLKAGITNEGSLSTNGALSLTARQIYPVTNGAFRFQTYGINSSIEIKSSGISANEIPLSSSGLLTLKADNIIQGGSLRAPLGQIVLDASNKLSFNGGSLTSISAEGQMIPYGLTRLGGLDITEPTQQAAANENDVALTKITAKQVSISAPSVEMSVGANINISGGGDTLAYEWINGIGGSSDILAKAGTFAVLPNIKKGEYAPFDYNYTQQNIEINAGDSIHIAGVKGLDDGDYALLPARYALLPGAFMVQASTKAITDATSALQVDGSTLVSTYKSNGGYTDTNYSAFKVTDAIIFHTTKGGISKAESEYRLTYGNQFFTKLAQDSDVAIPRLSSDAGQLVVNASNSLVLDATFSANKAATARGALVDITSNAIKVVSTKGADEVGVLQLTASSLNNLNAESLLLGGTRTANSDGSTQITAGASRLEFANNNQNALSVKELIAASTNTLTVASGATISAATASGSTATTKLKTAGTGALLAVSSLNDLELERTGGNATGDLSIATDSNISVSRSMVLDSRDTANLAGTVSVSNAGSISLGAGRMLLGDSGSATGFKISNSLLSSFGQLSKVTLNSYKNIDIYGAVDLGNTTLDLTLNAGAIAGHMGFNQTATLRANNFILKNTLGAVYESVSSVSGSQLEINANNIQLVGGSANPGKDTSTTVAGFGTVQLDAAKEITVAGLGTTNFNATTTNLKSSSISAATAADFTIVATGGMTTALQTTEANLADASGLGAKLTMTATTLTLGGKVNLSGGQLIAKAITGDLTVTGQLKATSVPITFDKDHKYIEYTPAGSITLQTTGSGNVVVNSGGLVDVSGVDEIDPLKPLLGADAGNINIISKGSTTINGSLKGSASAGNKTGSFVLDTNTLPDFSKLNSALNTGSFSNLREMRVLAGDITIAALDTVTAKHVILSADTGKIDVFGTVDASGSNGGKIEMYARDNLTLKDSAKLLAKGSGKALVAGDSFVGAGGVVLLSSLSRATTSAISAESGALIDVSGDQQGAIVGEKGKVTMRAYRGTTGTTNTVNVDTTATATVKGAEKVRLEGVREYTATVFNTITPTLVSDTNAFYMANPGAGIYTSQDGANVTILPNIEVRSSGNLVFQDLTINADVDLRSFGSAPLQAGKGGTLTLRSNNNLKVNGTLSDGFNGVAANSVLQTGNTFNFNLVSGADLSSANQIATIKSADATIGNFTLANNKIIRTGTGEINIAAGGNLTMGNESSVIYTVGKAADTFEVFTPPAYTTSLTSNGITSASYLTQGGDIDIKVDGDITGKIAAGSSQQLISQWLFRQGGGTGNKNVSWWVRPDLFKQGVATMGGGDVSVNAGGSISNFSASAPTTARFNATGDDVSLNGGGNLFIKAGGSIKSGIYFAGKGYVDLFAGEKITSAVNNFGTTLALQDASAKIIAVKDVAIETIFNPTMWAQSSVNAPNGLGVDGSNSFFMTYGQSSTVYVSSLYGDVTFGLTATANITNKISAGLPNSSKVPSALEVMPGDLQAVSFAGNIGLGRLVLSPTPNGNLNLLASGSVSTKANGIIGMSDADVNILPTVLKPISDSSKIPAAIIYLRYGHAASAVHLSDNVPLVVVAKNGSINMPGASGGFGLSSPKAIDIFAGKDVSINASIQHSVSQNLSVIHAGRDVVMPLTQGSTIQIAGPGEFFIEAGRNVNLGASEGISAVANTLNPALPAQGGSLTVLAGLGSEGSAVAGYVASYINPTGLGPSTLQGNSILLGTYRSDTAKAVASYMRNMTGNLTLSEDAAMTQYLELDLDRQSIFAYRHFSSELLASGKGYAESQNHNRGDNAIASLFPSNRAYKGDLSLYNSQIRTSRDGSVDILTPGGFINAGVPTSSGNNIGIVTERGGAIRAFAETGFQVEQSKIITQYGSDITVWVNNGDIDAGRGSKTALSVPQRVVSTNADGKTTIEAKGAAAGSGIRAQTYDPDGPTGVQIAPTLGSVALIAPRGVLNASEAGIAAGNFLAVATVVLGANNISVTGTSSGVPAASTGSVAGAMTGVSNVAADATKSIANDITRQATANATVKKPMPSLISVEVIGLGD